MPVIRGEHVPLDGRIEIMHCVCEKLRNRRLRLKASVPSSYGRGLYRKAAARRSYAFLRTNYAEVHSAESHSVSPMQVILQSGFFIDFGYREHAVRL